MSTGQEARRDEGDSRRGQEASLRDRAHLSQQRRLKQATQFLHKDSADLLPLDSLKRLGTSKDLQPHSVIQRRLVEGNQRRLQGESPLVQALIHGHDSSRTSGTQVPALLVNCKCQDQMLRVAVDTGTQHNQISTGCLRRLGLGKRVPKAPGGDLAPGPPSQVEELELELGQETVACSAQVVGESSSLSPLLWGTKVEVFGAPSQDAQISHSAVLNFMGGLGRKWARVQRRASVVTDAISFSNGSCRCGQP
ncbi:putative gene 44596 [Cricetulus griseus]